MKNSAKATCTLFDSDSEIPSSTTDEDPDTELDDVEELENHFRPVASKVQNEQRLNCLVTKMVVIVRVMINSSLLIVKHISPYAFGIFGFLIFYSYTTNVTFLEVLPANWSALGFFFKNDFKIMLLIILIIACFVMIAHEFARHWSIVRAIWSVELENFYWAQRDGGGNEAAQFETKKHLATKKVSHFVSAKLAQAMLSTKTITFGIVGIAFLVWLLYLIYSETARTQRSESLSTLAMVGAHLLIMALLSDNLMTVRWGAIVTCSLLHALCLMIYFLQCKLPLSSSWAFGKRFAEYRDTVDYISHLELPELVRLGEAHDFVLLLFSTLADGAFIGILHSMGFFRAMLKPLGAFGNNFVGLTGLETLAALSAEFLPLPSVMLVLMPFLGSMSESELTFALTIGTFGGVAVSERRLLYWGIDKQLYLRQAAALRQLNLTGAIIVSRIVCPLGKSYKLQETKVIMASKLLCIAMGAAKGLKTACRTCIALVLATCGYRTLYAALDLFIYFNVNTLLLTDFYLEDAIQHLLSCLSFLLSDSFLTQQQVGDMLVTLVSTANRNRTRQWSSAAAGYGVARVFADASYQSVSRYSNASLLAFRGAKGPAVQQRPMLTALAIEQGESLLSSCAFAFVLLNSVSLRCRAGRVVGKFFAIKVLLLLLNIRLLWQFERLSEA